VPSGIPHMHDGMHAMRAPGYFRRTNSVQRDRLDPAAAGHQRVGIPIDPALRE